MAQQTTDDDNGSHDGPLFLIISLLAIWFDPTQQ